MYRVAALQPDCAAFVCIAPCRQFGTVSKTTDNRVYNTVDTLNKKYLVQLNYSVKRAGCFVAGNLTTQGPLTG